MTPLKQQLIHTTNGKQLNKNIKIKPSSELSTYPQSIQQLQNLYIIINTRKRRKNVIFD